MFLKFINYSKQSLVFKTILVVLSLILSISFLAKTTHAQQDEFIEFKDADFKLTVSVDTSLVEGLNVEFAKESNKIIWEYVGPENVEEVIHECTSFGWDSIKSRSTKIEAKLIGETQAEVSLDFSVGHTNDYAYCFKIGWQDQDTQEIGYTYKPHGLKSVNPPVEKDEGFKFTFKSPLPDTDIPSSIIITTLNSQKVKADSWQYALVETENSCHPDSSNVSFTSINSSNDEASSSMATLALDKTFAGKIICFRASDMSEESQLIYDSYNVASTSIVDDDSASRSARIIIAIVIVFVIGGLIFLRRSKAKLQAEVRAKAAKKDSESKSKSKPKSKIKK